MSLITTKSGVVISTNQKLTQYQHYIKAVYVNGVGLSLNSLEIKMLSSLVFSLALNVAFSQAFSIQPRILNGNISNPVDYSYFVNVEHAQMSCGGALISDR